MSTYKFNSKDFYKKKDKQNECCALTGIRLEPHTCDISHVVPLHKGGKHEYDNVQLIHKDLVKIARGLTNDEILEYAIKIVETLGKTKGFTIKRKSK